MRRAQKENPKMKVKPQELNRWEEEGGNPDPRFIQAKNADYGQKLVTVLKNMLFKISRPTSTAR